MPGPWTGATPHLSTRRSLGRRVVTLVAAGWMAAAGGMAAAAPMAAARATPSWPMAGGDAAHTGMAEGPAPPYTVAWQATVPGGLAAAPVVAGGLVVAVGRDRVLALQAASGEPSWEAERSPGPAGSAAVGGQVVVHASGAGSQGALVGRSLEDGRERWRVFTGSSVPGAPVVDEERAYVGAADGSVRAIGLQTGEVIWTRRLEGSIRVPVTVAAGVVLAVGEEIDDTGLVTTLVMALDPESGRELWRFPSQPGGPGATPVSVADSTGYLGSGDGQVHAIDLATGAERWASRTESGFSLGPPLFSSAQVAAVPGDPIVADVAHLQRFDAATGEERWSFRVLDGLFRSGVTVVGDYALVGEQLSSRVSAIDLATGRRVWRSQDLGPGSATSVAADGDRVYVGLLGEVGAATPSAGGAFGQPNGRVIALEHDPTGRLGSEPSESTLVLWRALLNFVVAAVAVTVALLALFRFGPRTRTGEAP